MNGLSGSYRVRVFGAALREARKTWPRVKDRMRVRRHALKLRYWPEVSPRDEQGTLLDLDWCWIRALKGSRVGELRVHDAIGGCDNIRIIFFVPDNKVAKVPDKGLPVIWVLAAIQKKRNEFTEANLKVFRFRRTLVLERFYKV